MTKKLLVVVDTQYDFAMPDGALYVPGGEEIILPGIKYLAHLPKDIGWTLFTFDTHSVEGWEDTEEGKIFPIHCVHGTPGWENVFNSRTVKTPAFYLAKGVFDMWVNADTGNIHSISGENHLKNKRFFDQLLGIPENDLVEKPAQLADTAVVFGLAYDYCVYYAVRGLITRGFKVELIKDLCRAISPEGEAYDYYTEQEAAGNLKFVTV